MEYFGLRIGATSFCAWMINNKIAFGRVVDVLSGNTFLFVQKAQTCGLARLFCLFSVELDRSSNFYPYLSDYRLIFICSDLKRFYYK